MIQVIHVTKKYNGYTAVNDLTFEIPKGEIFGFVGKNGAGKTTTINMLTGIIEPTKGKIYYFEHRFHAESLELKKRMGVVPATGGLFPYLKVKEHLYLFARLYGVKKKEARERVQHLLDLFELGKNANKLVYHLSSGMKKKLVFSCAVIHKPELLFLDEPFLGLDVESVYIIKEILRNLQKNGTTIFITSHNLYLVEELCSLVGVIENGKLILFDSMEEVKKRLKVKYPDVKGSILEKLILKKKKDSVVTVDLNWI